MSVYSAAVLLLTFACVGIAKETAKVDIDEGDTGTATGPAAVAAPAS